MDICRRLVFVSVLIFFGTAYLHAAEKVKYEIIKVEEETDSSSAAKATSYEGKRYMDNGDGTVLDKNTDLVWLKDANISKSGMPLPVAKQFIQEMNEGRRDNFGFSDWRMPTIKEMETLVDRTRFYPALLADHPFVNVQNSFYWSSSETNDIVSNAWIADLASGNIVLDYVSYCNFRYLWPVRDNKPRKAGSGTVQTMGINDHGQLGEKTPSEERDTFSQVKGLADINKIVAGMEHAVAIKTDGTVWTWGRNAESQLGDGTSSDRDYPAIVKGIWNVTKVAADMYHTTALKSDGTVWAWGRNYNGQLGDATTVDRNLPVQVKELTNVTDIAAGTYHTVALKSDGTVWAWGWNKYGQLGDGTFTDKNLPFQVKGLADIVSIAAGMYHTIALKSDGTVWAWGWNKYGLLGDSTTIDKNTPVQVKGLANVVAIESGMNHNLAMKTDGTVWAWGTNEYGQLGNPNLTAASEPVMVESIRGAKKIAAGMYHSVVFTSEGFMWIWGKDFKNKNSKMSPVKVVTNFHGIADISAGKYLTVVLIK